MKFQIWLIPLESAQHFMGKTRRLSVGKSYFEGGVRSEE